MKDLFKNKLATSLVVVATIILAGVAIFTALRLYQLRTAPVAPTAPAEPLAWYCDKYTFSVDGSGIVTVRNDSPRSETPQQAVVYINNVQVATFDVPALPQGQSAVLGTVQVPKGQFSWRVVGTVDCSNSGTATSGPTSCELLTFSITTPSNTPTLTPTASPTSTPTPSSTSTPTPTDVPPADCNDVCQTDSDCSDTLVCYDAGATSYCRNPSCTTETSCSCPASTATPTSTPTNTPSPTDAPRGGGETPTNTPTPTSGGQISAVSPTPGGTALPDAGVSMPTIMSFGLGLLIVAFAVLLAL